VGKLTVDYSDLKSAISVSMSTCSNIESYSRFFRQKSA